MRNVTQRKELFFKSKANGCANTIAKLYAYKLPGGLCNLFEKHPATPDKTHTHTHIHGILSFT